MSQTLDQTMEQASIALAEMDYLTCEDKCLSALAAAREQENWAYYARILMPLQECRRQRRMEAAEGRVHLGLSKREQLDDDAMAELTAGCIVVTHPADTSDAVDLIQSMRQQRRYVEVLFTDNDIDSDTWRLTAFEGPEVSCAIDAPPVEWRDRWFHFGEELPTQSDVKPAGPPTPADWFIDATEKLGDAALAQVDENTPARERLDQLEARLQVVTDHEFLHQTLARAARDLMRP